MEDKPSLHVFVSGFGSPHLAEKLRILKNNMSIIERYGWSQLQYTICCYDSSDLTELEALPNVTVIRDPLIVGQFLKKYLVPNTPSTAFTYLLCILDDIELQADVDFGWMIQHTEMFDIDILSPSMTQDSKYQFPYTLHDPGISYPAIKITSALEYFCYFMRPSSYKRYYEHLNGERNPWMWGLDMLLYRHVGMKPGIINHMTMKHWYKNENYSARLDADPCEGYNYVMERYNENTDSLASQPSVLYVILAVAVNHKK